MPIISRHLFYDKNIKQGKVHEGITPSEGKIQSNTEIKQK